MLQLIRDRLTGGFALVILGVIFVPFAFFGLTKFNFLSDSWAARVDDVEISVFQLDSAFNNQMLQLVDYGELPAEYLASIRRSTLERLIRDTLIEKHVAASGYSIDDAMVAKVIQNAPQFKENGVFNKQLYYDWLDATAQDATRFEAQQRNGMRNGQLQRGIGATAFVTPSEYRRYLNLFAEQRQVSIANFDIAALADTVVVKDEDVAALYESTPDGFRSPETVDIDYIDLRRDLLMQAVEISEEEMLQAYEESADRFRQDEQREARHILVLFGDDEAAAEQQAAALAARAQAGEPFADLASQYSMDGGTSEQGGALGTVRQSQMPGALGDAIFAMNKGEIRGPVRSEFGFHVVQLDDTIAGGPMPLEQVRSDLEGELKALAADDRFLELDRALSNALFDAKDLRSMAEANGLEVTRATGFTRSGGQPFGASQAVIDAVFDPGVLEGGRISDVVEIDNNRSVVVQVAEYHPEARRPLAEVSEDIRFSLQSQRAMNMVEDRSRRFIEALQNGESFESAAVDVEAVATTNMLVGRQNDTLDANVINEIFRARKPQPGNARIEGTTTTVGDYVVFAVTAVIPGRPESIPLADRDSRKNELQGVAGAADLAAYVTELGLRAEIERNDAALQQPDAFQ